MKKQIGIELLKLRRQKKSKVLFFVTLALTAFVCIGNMYVGSTAGFFMIDSDRMPISLIGLLSGLVLPIVAYVMAIDSTANEAQSGTMKYGFMAPIHRYEYFLAKALALGVYNAIILGSVFVLSFVLNVFTMSGPILVNFGQGLMAYIITIIPMTLISLWGLLIGMYVPSGLGLGIGIIGVIALNIGQLFMPILGVISPVGYMDLYSSIIYGNTTLLATLSVLLYVASYYIMLIALNITRMNQKEV